MEAGVEAGVVEAGVEAGIRDFPESFVIISKDLKYTTSRDLNTRTLPKPDDRNFVAVSFSTKYIHFLNVVGYLAMLCRNYEIPKNLSRNLQ